MLNSFLSGSRHRKTASRVSFGTIIKKMSFEASVDGSARVERQSGPGPEVDPVSDHGRLVATFQSGGQGRTLRVSDADLAKAEQLLWRKTPKLAFVSNATLMGGDDGVDPLDKNTKSFGVKATCSSASRVISSVALSRLAWNQRIAAACTVGKKGCSTVPLE